VLNEDSNKEIPMKRYLSLILLAVALAAPSLARAQTGPMMFAPTCIGTANYGNAYLCFDTGLNTFNVWNGTTFSVISNASGTTTSPLVLNGTSSGHINISSGATPTAYTFTLKSTVPAQGDILDFSNGAGQVSSLADVATGSVLVSGGVATVPAYSATPSVTTVTASGSIDKTLNVSNGGHISNPIGSGVAPTTGTGTVVAGGTDTAMRVTGGTSPVTVTFGTAFAVAPVCVCSNGTTAADGCKTSAEGTTSVVVTTASTDTFSLVCVGK
jgi:hypothetical protein